MKALKDWLLGWLSRLCFVLAAWLAHAAERFNSWGWKLVLRRDWRHWLLQ